jgi:phosphoribosylglycinamide formyltransferase 1
MPYRLVFIGSTGGAVLSQVACHALTRGVTLEVVSDRPCGFLDVARRNGIDAVELTSVDGPAFSRALAQRYAGRADLVFLSFYTRLFRDPFLSQHQGRLFNCHPSLLPAFPGTQGFEDTLASSALFMGATLHAVDAGIDTGPALLQAALPLDRSLPVAENRHRIFLAQVYSALQFVRWVAEDRLRIGPGGAHVADARFGLSAFSPNLDPDLFDAFGITDSLA